MKGNRKDRAEQFWLTYKKRPGSLTMLILVIISAAVTVGVLFSLIVYILTNAPEAGTFCMGI